MITRKRWTDAEEQDLLHHVTRMQENGMKDEDIFGELATWDNFKVNTRTQAALRKRHSELVSVKSGSKSVRKDETYNGFLEAIQDLKNSYDAVYTHNVQLRERIKELEQKEKDFDMMAKIMEQARKMVVNEQLGAHEQTRFKMDSNGNLERV